MSFAFRASLLLLALSLNLVNSAPAQSQSSSSASKAPPLIPGSPQSSDEATIRALTEKYGLAIAAGDLETMRQFWDPQSPNMASQLNVYQDVFSLTRLEFVGLKVTRLEVAGEKAVSHLTTDERQLDKRTGTTRSARDVFHGNCRALEWVKTGAEAREDRAKTEAGDFRVLHFATHGVLNDAAPMYSHLVLARGDKNEDGLLEAWELMQMDLRADLVVLSACETARGRFGAGEGVIGLSWAMFVAGAPATVVSQWQVESASTRDLMLDFHRALRAPAGTRKAPATKAEALRQAALKLMKIPETSHPFYWAGFVLVGDGK